MIGLSWWTDGSSLGASSRNSIFFCSTPGFSFSEEHAGTNGIGTALAEAGPVFVKGGEHFADAFVETACAAAPIADPRTNQILGIIDLSTAVSNAQSLMLPFVKRASWEIEQRLIEGSPLVERMLYQRFLDARRRARSPIVVVGEHTMLTNTSASRLVLPVDQERLWDWAERVVSTSRSGPCELELTTGLTSLAKCEAVYEDRVMVGAVIRLGAVAGARPADGRAPSRVHQPGSGWESLTDTERSVAELVAEGYTNREAAASLFISWHTVDSHLRHIFAKLDISSRIHLARIASQHR